MAGGIHAATVPCAVCMWDFGTLTEARRTREGVESDTYVCDQGHSFGLDWSSGPAGEPQWPPPAELRDALANKVDPK